MNDALRFSPDRLGNARRRFDCAKSHLLEYLLVNRSHDALQDSDWSAREITPLREILLLIYDCFAAAHALDGYAPPAVFVAIDPGIKLKCSRWAFIVWMVHSIDHQCRRENSKSVLERSWIHKIREEKDTNAVVLEMWSSRDFHEEMEKWKSVAPVGEVLENGDQRNWELRFPSIPTISP